MTIDLDALDGMTKDDLETLRKETDRKLRDYDERRRREARSVAETAIKDFGYTLEDLVAPSSNAKGAKKSPPRYRHPENASVTWTGRGRKPGWVNDHLKNGGKIEDLAI